MPKGDTHKKKHEQINKRAALYNSKELKKPKDDEGEQIGIIVKPLGNCYFDVEIISDSNTVRAVALGTFQKGPRKEHLAINNYVIIQPGIEKGKYYINHKYTDDDIEKLHDLGYINKPTKSKVIDKLDFVEETDIIKEEKNITLDDIWDI
jgi:hypothetical protein